MNERQRNREEQYLEESLEREARQTRPAFSDALHARLCAAVGGAARAERRHSTRRLLAAWSMAVAASIMLLADAAWLSGDLGGRPQDAAIADARPPQTPVEADDLDSAGALVDQAATGLSTWMEMAVGNPQWAGLDRDARAALDAVTSPLPFDLSLSVAKE